MKSHILFCVLLLSALVSCTKESCYSNDVDEFVKQLIEGECDSYRRLPRFDSNDIPALLNYADDFQEINCFPIGMVSSFIPSRYILGECLLRTIELIKTYKGIDDLKYSTWLPMLVKDEYNNDPELRLLDSDELLEVFFLYKDWWEENSKDKEFEDFRYIDVLKDTGYHWL